MQFGKVWEQQSDLNTDQNNQAASNQSRAWLDCSKSNHPDLTQKQDVNEACCLLLLVSSNFFFFYIGKANYNLDLAIFWTSGLRKCWIQFTKLLMSLFTNHLALARRFPCSTTQLCFQPCPFLHTLQQMFSGFVKCETELRYRPLSGTDGTRAHWAALFNFILFE